MKNNLELLTRGVEEIIVKENLEKKLKKKKLRIKFGIDPTAPEIHLGHAVVIRKLKQFQDLGHQVVLIIGDWTAMIGDPSGRDQTRKALSKEEVEKNAKNYFTQAFKILDERKTEAHHQSEWFSNFDLRKTIELQSKVTVEQLLEHETFKKRLQKHLPLSTHELIYPLLQGYDSVAIKSDLELGGRDQKFNLLMGREIQRAYGEPSQDILTMRYLIGLDGKEKMSKTLKNYIAITDSPHEMYGKLMSLPDNLIIDYFELATDLEMKALDIIKKEVKKEPLKAKQGLAKLIVETYHDLPAAEEAEEEFNRIFRQKGAPSKLTAVHLAKKDWDPIELLIKTKLASSKSEARRLISQGGVKIDGQVIDSSRLKVNSGQVLKVGKRKFLKLNV